MIMHASAYEYATYITPNQVKTILHSLELATAGIGLHVMHTKLNICAITKQVTFTHKTEPL